MSHDVNELEKLGITQQDLVTMSTGELHNLLEAFKSGSYRPKEKSDQVFDTVSMLRES